MNANQTNQPPRNSRFKQFLKLLAAFAGGIAVCFAILLACLVAQHLRARHAHNAWKETMRAKGEKFDIDELVPATVPPPAERDVTLQKATEQLVAVSIRPSDLCDFDFVSRGKVRVKWKREFPIHDKSEHSWNELETEMQLSSTQLRQIRAALTIPADGVRGNHKNLWERLPNYVPWRTAGYWLVTATINDLHHERHNNALENLVALAELTGSHSAEPSLVNQMIRTAVSHYGVVAVWEALQSLGWNDEQLARLQAAWQEIEIAHLFESSVNLERAVQLQMFTMIKKSLTNFEQNKYELDKEIATSMGTEVPTAPNGSLLKRFVYFPFWKFMQADRDELFLLQALQPEMELSRSISHLFNAQPVLKFNGLTNVIPAIRITDPLTNAIRMLVKQGQIHFFSGEDTNSEPKIFPTFAPGDNTGQTIVEIYWENATIPQALEALLDNYSLALYADPISKTVRVAPKEDWMLPPPMDESVSDIPKTPTGEEKIPAVRFDSLTTVAEAIRTLAQQMGINFVFDPLVEHSSATVELFEENKTPREILEKVLNENGLVIKYNPTTKIARVTTKKPAPQPKHSVRASWPTLRDRLKEEHFKTEGKFELLKPDGRTHFFLTEYGPPGYSRAIESLLRNETDREMMLAAIGLKRYELRHKKYPSSLAALVPEILPHMPRDYMSGEALRYRLKPDGSYVLYSVGKDSYDDGGEINPCDPKEMWEGHDAIWPNAATDSLPGKGSK